jgi:hypothetical protein
MIERQFNNSGIVWIFLVALTLLGLGALSGCTTMYTQPAMAVEEYDDYEPAVGPVGGAFTGLDVYGEWVESGPYGWVWRPGVVAGWRPYAHGHWVWSTWGWTWVSYEPYGWAVYHYGEWFYDPVWGWLWVPGDTWYPARVQWILYDDYIGWAPYPPRGYFVGDPWSVDVRFIWNVVPTKHFTREHVGRFTVRPEHRKTSIKLKSSVIRKAPDRRWVEKHTKHTIRQVDVRVKKLQVGKKEYKKMQLPAKEVRKVERNSPKVKRQVLEREVRKKSTVKKSLESRSREKKTIKKEPVKKKSVKTKSKKKGKP